MFGRRPLLVIEDSDEDYEILESSLELAGVPNELIRCSTGAEISEYLHAVLKAAPSRRPTLVFLDLNLPGADGRAVLKKLREHPVLKAVPVIVLTTSSRSLDVETCYRSGASGYLIKPVDLDRFEAMVRQVTGYWFDCVCLPENTSAFQSA